MDRGELPDLPDAFQVADVEAVQCDQVTGAGGEVTEPERSLHAHHRRPDPWLPQ